MSYVRPTGLSSSVYCRDPRAEIAWLEAAFGFETTLIVEMEDGSLGHSELRLGEAMIYIGGLGWFDWQASPAALGGANTQSLHIHLTGGLDALFTRAVAAGAKVVREPEDQFYGDRNFVVADPEGHVWSFSQTAKAMTFEEMERAAGVKIRERL